MPEDTRRRYAKMVMDARLFVRKQAVGVQLTRLARGTGWTGCRRTSSTPSEPASLRGRGTNHHTYISSRFGCTRISPNTPGASKQ